MARDEPQSFIQRLKAGPLNSLTSEEKKKMSDKDLLRCMSISGISYSITVSLTMTISALTWSLPVLAQHSPAVSHQTESAVILYLFANVAVNFWFVMRRKSFCRPDSSSGMAATSGAATSGAATSGAASVADSWSLPGTNWKPCPDCELWVPPRAHHCVLCRRCVMRRDHHCFFTGSCVGLENHRYFLAFILHCALGASYCSWLTWQALHAAFLGGQPMGVAHYMLPLACLEWLLGYVEGGLMLAICLLYLCGISALGTVAMFSWQFFLVLVGQTTHEFTKGLPWSLRRLCHNLRAVFGCCWPLHFLAPLPFLPIPGAYGDRVPQGKSV